MMMKAWLIFPLIVVALTACADQADEQLAADKQQAAVEANSEATQEGDLAELARTDPESLRQAMRDPEQRQAMMEAMQQQRAEREQDPERAQQREEIRERLRQRREDLTGDGEAAERMAQRRATMRGNWWEDEALAESIELAPAQAESLGNAHQALDQARQSSRQALAQSQRQLVQALQAVDRDTVHQLLNQRQAAATSLAEAENNWLLALLDELSDEQIQTLASEHPHLLVSRRR
jgi:hypothetical protein